MADEYALEISKQAVARACVALGNHMFLLCHFITMHRRPLIKSNATEGSKSFTYRLQGNPDFNP
jgi:hypothetical protein